MGLSTDQLVAYKSKESKYSNALGQAGIISVLSPLYGLLNYPACSGKHKDICVKCKAEARSKPRNAWLRDGKENYISCFKRELEKLEALGQTGTYNDTQVNEILTQKENIADSPTAEKSVSESSVRGLNNNTALIIGGIAIIGVVLIIALKRK